MFLVQHMKITLDLSKWVKGLSLVASGNYKLAQRNKTEVKNEVTYYDWIGTVNGSKNGPGSLNESVEKWENVTLGGFANYERTFANIHSISAMIGMTDKVFHKTEFNANAQQLCCNRSERYGFN